MDIFKKKLSCIFASLLLCFFAHLSCSKNGDSPPTGDGVDRSQFDGNVFNFVLSRADGPRWNSDAGAWKKSDSETRQVLVWDETFQVPANTTVSVSNKIIEIRPTALVGSLSKLDIKGHLIIENCLMLWYSPIHRAPRISVDNGGKITLKNSYSFQANQFWVNWEFLDGSTVELDNFVGDSWTTMHGSVNYSAENYSTVKLTLMDSVNNSHVTVHKSHHVWFEIFPPVPSTIELTFPELKIWGPWSLNTIWPNTTVEVGDSLLFKGDISLRVGVHAIVRDSPYFSMGWILSKSQSDPLCTCVIEDMGDPSGIENTKYYADKTWDLSAAPCNLNTSLRLINSNLHTAWPTFWGNIDLTVRNSNLADTRNLGQGAVYRIYNSLVAILESSGEWNSPPGSVTNTYIENSTIINDLDAKHNGCIYYKNISSYYPQDPYTIVESNGGDVLEHLGVTPPF